MSTAALEAADRPVRRRRARARRRPRPFVRRVIELLAVVVLVTFGSTLVVQLMPGDPAASILGANHSPAEYRALDAQLGVNKSTLDQYFSWVSHALHGDLGTAISPPGGSVVSRLKDSVPVSLQLVVMAIVLALAISIPLALASASRPGGRLDRAISGLSYGLIALPAFVGGLLLILLLVKVVPVLPRGNWVSISDSFPDNLRHAILPAIVVAIPEIAVFTQVLRADLVETLRQDFVLAARARGMPRRRVLFRDALRPSMFSLVTLGGTSLATAIGSTVIAETLFNLPGLGSLIVGAASAKDIPLLQGAVVVIAILVVVVNSLVDLSYSWIDPRIRRGKS